MMAIPSFMSYPYSLYLAMVVKVIYGKVIKIDLSSQMNHEKHDEPKGEKHTNFCNENEEDKPKIEAVHCAQMCRKYTPNGEMGYPKWRNGIPQMVKWDIPKGKMGHPKWWFGV